MNMKKHYLLAASAALALFSAGYWAGTSRTVHAATPRTFELRIYSTYDGKYDDLLARFRDHTTKLFEKHGMTNIAYWNPTDDPKKGKQLYYVLAFPSREAAKKSWAEFQADPDWKAVQKASEANGKIVEKVESVFLEPTDFSPLQ
jgi:NIPSNAP